MSIRPWLSVTNPASGSGWVSYQLPYNYQASFGTALLFANNLFVNVGSGCVVSADGITWTDVSSGFFIDGMSPYFYLLTQGANTFLATPGNAGSRAATARVARSADGFNWTTSATGLPSPGGNNTKWNCMTYGNGSGWNGFMASVAGQYSPMYIARSADGNSWTFSQSAPLPGNVEDITFGKNLFVAKMPRDIWTSLDGLTWTQVFSRAGSDNDFFYRIAFVGGKFIAIMRGYVTSGDQRTNICAVSDDGSNWVIRQLPVIAPWSSVAYGNNQFIMTALQSNFVATSPDAITWKLMSLPKATSLEGLISFGNGKFVIAHSPSEVFVY